MTWTDELAVKIPIQLVLELKRLTRSAGAEKIAALHLTTEEAATVLEVCMPDVDSFDYRMFCAAAWQAGASYRQIARVVERNHGTVYNHANRFADTKTRLQTSCPQERLERMWAIWNTRAGKLAPSSRSSTIAAQLLFTTIDNTPPPPIDYDA